MIGEIFFTVFIWPIYFILEFLFVLFIRIFDAPYLDIIFLSIVVNTFLLPLYLTADRWQKEDKELQSKMKKKLDVIRACFKGDERQMITNAYHRQTGYSPVFMLKSSVGLLLQIPFFIAAYQFLSHTEMLSGVSFLFLQDLNAPDAFIKFPFTINIMPFIMTAINLLSAFVYTRDMGKKERIQLLVTALVFLILLYNSPSGLVLYWTMNNIYSLAKNMAIKYMRNPGIILKIGAIAAGIVFFVFIWTGKANVERYGIMFSVVAMLFILIPFFWDKIAKLPEKINFNFIKTGSLTENNIAKKKITDDIYLWAFALIFLLTGFLNPAQVLSTSTEDFDEPFLFLARTALQAFSFLFLVPLFIRFFSVSQKRKILETGACALALSSLACYFILFASYGVMDRNFKLDDTDRLLHAFPLWLSLAVPSAALIVSAVFFILKKQNILNVFFKIICAALFVLGTVNTVNIGKYSARLSQIAKADTGIKNNVFKLSRTNENVFIISLDRAQGSAFEDALNYKPELINELDGFIFYPNTISFGPSTVTAVPSLLGGYDYTPDKINKRENELLVDKVNSAIKTMPKLFGENGYRVTITDPVIANMQSVADISIFKGMANVDARLLSGKLTERFKNEFPPNEKYKSRSFDFDILFRYGIFRIAPPVLRYGIYYKGQWWREEAYNSYGRAVGEFSSLYYLNDICSIDDGEPTLNIMMNFITHEGGAYSKDFFPQNKNIEFGDEEIQYFGSKDNAEYMYVLIAAIKQIIKWINYLKEENIYDNTKIIITSDHGGRYKTARDTSGMEGYNPIFLFKEFNRRGILKASDYLMTNAETRYAAASHIELNDYIENVLEVYSASSSQPLRHGPYKFDLTGRKKLIGKDVLKAESWEEWERY